MHTVFLVESKQLEEKITEEVQDTDHQVGSEAKSAGVAPKMEGRVCFWPFRGTATTAFLPPSYCPVLAAVGGL